MNTEKRMWWPFILCFLCVTVSAQVSNLEPGQNVSREIAGGESHSYQITLAAGQFLRFRLEQQTLDSSLQLISPDGKSIADVNLTDAGNSEAFALEAMQAGVYQLVVRGNGSAAMRGAYLLNASTPATATAQDRKHIAAQTLLLEAMELTKLGAKNAPQAIAKLEQSLAIWRELGVPFWIGLTLNRMGRAYMLQNQPDKAIPFLEQSITIQRELKSQTGEAGVMNNLANAYFNLRQFPKAIELFEQTLALSRAAKDRRWEGLILHSLGNTNANLNQIEKALALYDQSLTILREVNDLSSQGQAQLNQGRMYINRGESEKAIATTEASIESFRNAKDQSGEALALNNLAIIHSRIGQSEKAIQSLERALTIFRERKDRLQESNIVITMGTVYGGMGETEKAIEYFEQGLAIAREIKDKQREGQALINLGLAHQFLSNYEKALEYLETALPINREIKNRMLEGSNFSYLGTTNAGLSRFEKAIESHEQSLAIYRELKYRLGEGNALQNLGNVYKFIGRDDKAIEYYAQALPIFRETKYRMGEGNALSNIAFSYERLGRSEEARQTQEQALAIYRELKYRLGEGTAIMEMGVALFHQKQSEKALELYQQAIAILREVKERNLEALTLFRMGQAKQLLERHDEAATLLNESATIFKSLGNRNLEFGALTALAKTERTRGNLNQALTIIEESVRIVESLRSELLSVESRTSFLVGVQETYQVYADLLMQLHKVENSKGYDARAVEVSERQRSRSLLDLLIESRIDLRQGLDAALISRERNLAKQLNDKAQQLAQSTKPEQTTKLKQEIGQIETEIERAQVAIRNAYPNYASLTQPQPLKLKEIQQQLDADTLLLEYELGAERSYVWAITNNSITSFELPKEEVIEKSARQVYELLKERSIAKRRETAAQQRQRIAKADANLPIAAQALSQIILAPTKSHLGSKRIVVVADGALQYVPFAMLPDPQSAMPLIVKHEVVSLPSASALAIQRAELNSRKPASKLLAVIADPVFDRSDARLTNIANNNAAIAQTRSFDDERSIVHLAEPTDDQSNAVTRKLVIPRLPFTKQEASQLLALAPKESSFSALGLQATRTAVLSSELSQYRYVHFATHGVLDSERPGLSSLLLSMVDEQGNAQDGFLRANDIYNLKLPADLVVLSACQTGLGKEIKGEGLVGLTRGFMYAGAARVVVSLWNVNDQATAVLMTKFYQKMLKQNERPAAALRAAQVEMWKQKQWNAPFYWAAFTLQGEWR